MTSSIYHAWLTTYITSNYPFKGVLELFATPDKSAGNWLDVIAKSIPDAKAKELPTEDLGGMKKQADKKRSKLWERRLVTGFMLLLRRWTNELNRSSIELGGLQQMFAMPTQDVKKSVTTLRSECWQSS